MPIMPTIVGFRRGDAVVPTSTGYNTRTLLVVDAIIGFLEAHISAESAIGGRFLTMSRLAASKLTSRPAVESLEIEVEVVP